jgi:hypothetical protein
MHDNWELEWGTFSSFIRYVLDVHVRDICYRWSGSLCLPVEVSLKPDKNWMWLRILDLTTPSSVGGTQLGVQDGWVLVVFSESCCPPSLEGGNAVFHTVKEDPNWL